MISYFMWLETLDDRERAFFEKLFLDYSPKVKRLALNLTHNEADAEDLVGAVFEKVMKYKDKFLGADEQQICRRLVLYAKSGFVDEQRRKKKIRFESLDEPESFINTGDTVMREPADEGVDILAEIIKRETAASLRRHIDALGEPAASVVYLTYYAEHTSAEIGEILGLPAATVRTILARSRKKLKENMEEELYDRHHGSAV